MNNWIGKSYDVLAFFFVWSYPPIVMTNYLVSHKLDKIWWITYPVSIIGIVYGIGSIIAVTKIKDTYEDEEYIED